METSKTLVLISDKKAKSKLNCAECLTDRAFILIKWTTRFRTASKKIFSLLIYFIKEHGDLLRKVQEKTENLNEKNF